MTDDLKRRSAIRSLLKDAAKEMNFAVGDIRSELVDRGWFGRDSGYEDQEAFESYHGMLNEREQEAAGPQDFSQARDAVYGRDQDGRSRGTAGAGYAARA